MSNLSAKKLLNGHGQILCLKCNKIIISCRCMHCSDNIIYDICDQCMELDSKNQSSLKDLLCDRVVNTPSSVCSFCLFSGKYNIVLPLESLRGSCGNSVIDGNTEEKDRKLLDIFNKIISKNKINLISCDLCKWKGTSEETTFHPLSNSLICPNCNQIRIKSFITITSKFSS